MDVHSLTQVIGIRASSNLRSHGLDVLSWGWDITTLAIVSVMVMVLLLRTILLYLHDGVTNSPLQFFNFAIYKFVNINRCYMGLVPVNAFVCGPALDTGH